MMATKKLVQCRSNPELHLSPEEVEESAAASHESINLDALDGYALPECLDTDDNENLEEGRSSTNQPKKKKKNKEKREDVLGVEYREREEKRLEELLFGDLLDKFQKETGTCSDVYDSETERKNTYLSEDCGDVKEGTLPQDLFGNRLGLNKTSKKNPAWIDGDDEETK